MALYSEIIFILSIILGFWGIFKEINLETIKILEKNIFTKWTVAKYFKLSRKIHIKIAKSVQEGKFSSSIKFGWGIFTMWVYIGIIGLFFYIIKVIGRELGFPVSPSYIEGFGMLLGAGVAAFFVWVKTFLKQAKYNKFHWKEGKKVKAIGMWIGNFLKAINIGIAYFIWIYGQVIFLTLTPEKANWVEGFARTAFLYGLLLLFIVATGSLFVKAENKEIEVPEEDSDTNNDVSNEENKSESKPSDNNNS